MNYFRKLFATRAQNDEINNRRPAKADAPPDYGPDDPSKAPNPSGTGVYDFHKVFTPTPYKGRKVNGRRQLKVAPSAYQPWTPPPKPDAPDQAGPAETPTQ